MTTLVGIRENDLVWIGADTLLSSDCVRLGNASKLIVVQNADNSVETCIAVSGHRTAYHALFECLTENTYDWTSAQEVYKNLCAIHHEMREHHGLLTAEDGDVGFESSQYQAIIGNSYGLWMVLSTREVVGYTNGFCAVGSGRDLAIGAMSVIGMDDPKRAITRAIVAASRYDKSTGKEVETWTNQKD